MGKPLTAELVIARSKTDNLYLIKNLNLWGNDLEDIRLLRQMPNVEVLSLSVNKIASLKEFSNCPKLQELYLRKNNITDLTEIRYLTNLPSLRVLWLWDNPCSEVSNYREMVIKVLPNLIKLDNNAVTTEEKSIAAKLNTDLDYFKISKDDLRDNSPPTVNEKKSNALQEPQYSSNKNSPYSNIDAHPREYYSQPPIQESREMPNFNRQNSKQGNNGLDNPRVQNPNANLVQNVKERPIQKKEVC